MSPFGLKINVAVQDSVAFVGHAPKVGDVLRVGTSATECSSWEGLSKSVGSCARYGRSKVINRPNSDYVSCQYLVLQFSKLVVSSWAHY